MMHSWILLKMKALCSQKASKALDNEDAPQEKQFSIGCCHEKTSISLLVFSILLIILLIFGNRFQSPKAFGEVSLSTLKQLPQCAEMFTKFDNASLQVGQSSLKLHTRQIKAYNKSDVRKCLGNKTHTFALLGDSRMRQIAAAFRRYSYSANTPDGGYHTDYVFHIDNLVINSVWQIYVDQDLTDHVAGWIQQHPKIQLDLVLVGNAAWQLRDETYDLNAAKSALKRYQNALQSVSPLLNALNNYVPVIWVGQGPGDFVKFNNIGPPPLHSISDYNAVAEAVLKETNVTYWKSAAQIAEALFGTSPDFLHYSDDAIDRLINIIFNFYCNLKTGENSSEYYCSSETDIHALFTRSVLWEILLTVFVVICLNYSLFLINVPSTVRSILSLVQSLLVLFAVTLLYYIFEKTEKHSSERHFSALNFYLPCILVAVLACFTTVASSDSSILRRDQTDEWKGWMQMIMIIYHVTGFSHDLVIYMNLRCLASSYLVLTGYGHFSYYIRGGTFGILRGLQVIMRMNLFCAILCITMNQPYQFYSFIPLVTFSYFVVCLTLLLPPRVTQDSLAGHPRAYLFLCAKLLVAASMIAALYFSEVSFEKVFSVPIWRRLFTSSDGSLSSWRFRWSFDRFSALCGVLLGMVTHAIARTSVELSTCMRYSLAAIASAGVFAPTALGLMCHSQLQCNEIHSFLFVVPVVSFVYLRNMTETLRQSYSSMMAWSGRISLELFLLQHHLWPSVDAARVQHVLPWPSLNEALLASLLLSTSSITHVATECITQMLTQQSRPQPIDSF